MSLKYVEGRIKEALRLSGGNIAMARQRIIAWTSEDSKLLQSIARPHLSGIVAYNIERVASGRSDKARAKSQTPPPKKPAQQLNDEQFGMEIIKALANSDGAVFGMGGDEPYARPGKASQQHIDAIRQMADRSKFKK